MYKNVSFKLSFIQEYYLDKKQLIQDEQYKFFSKKYLMDQNNFDRNKFRNCLVITIKLKKNQIYVLLLKFEKNLILIEGYKIIPYHQRIIQNLKKKEKVHPEEKDFKENIGFLKVIANDLYKQLTCFAFDDFCTQWKSDQTIKIKGYSLNENSKLNYIKKTFLIFLHFIKFYQLSNEKNFSEIKKR